MIKKLSKHGNSYALVIDKPILDLLNILPDQALEVSTDGERLIVRPSREEKHKQVRGSIQKAERKFGQVFKALAK